VHRLYLTIDEGLSEYLAKSKEKNSQVQLLLEANDEEKVLAIIKNEDFISQDYIAKKYRYK